MTRGRSLTVIAVAVAAPLSALAIAACGGSTTASTTPQTTPTGRPATLGVEKDATLGNILVDADGRTLYLFQKDSRNHSSCSGASAEGWPPLRASAKPVVGTGTSASLLATTARSDRPSQVTYNGHPLYRFAGDTKPGDTNGQGQTAFGGGWFALSPAGTIVAGTGSGGAGVGY
jgi:predicted lipoprotein with Yx(FWY)xxD motif